MNYSHYVAWQAKYAVDLLSVVALFLLAIFAQFEERYATRSRRLPWSVIKWIALGAAFVVFVATDVQRIF